MLSLEDCLAFSELPEDVILAIAEHEHVPEMAAIAIGEHLLDQEDGAEKIRDMIVEVIQLALGRNDRAHADALRETLGHFIEAHPKACNGADFSMP